MSSRPVATVGAVFRESFPVLEPDGFTKVSGETLAGGDFVATVWKDGAAYVGAGVVAIAEIGVTGEYALSFTPDGSGYYKIEVQVVYNSQLWAMDFDAAVAGGPSASGGSNDLSTEPVEAVIGRQVRLSFYEEDSDGVPETGLTLGSYTVIATANGAVVASATTALGVSLVEVSAANAAGEYEILLTPTTEGLLVFRLDRGTRRLRWIVRVARRGIVDLSAAMVAGASRVIVTAQDGASAAIEGVLVKVYDSTGTNQVARGTTNSSGQVELDLAPGSYKVYLTKTGYTFATTGATVVVPSGDEEAPVISNFLPTSVAAGDNIALHGRFFHLTAASNTVAFNDGDETTAAAAQVTADGTMVVVAVPAGLTAGSVNVHVRKPHPTSGTLSSNIIAVTAT